MARKVEQLFGDCDPVTGLSVTVDRYTEDDGTYRYELIVMDDSEGFTDGIPTCQLDCAITEYIDLSTVNVCKSVG